MLFQHALAVTMDNAVARVNLGMTLEQHGRTEEAMGEYHRAIEIDPGRFQAHNNLANLLASMGKRSEAVEEYREALLLNPKAAMAHANFGTLVSEMGKFNEAMAEYRAAASLAPDDPRPDYLMGKACLRHGDSVEGVKHLRDSLKIAPNDVQMLTWLARVLASDKDPDVRYGKDAVTLAQQANDLTRGGDPFVLDTLAMAYAEAGRFKEAQDTVQSAIDLASAWPRRKWFRPCRSGCSVISPICRIGRIFRRRFLLQNSPVRGFPGACGHCPCFGQRPCPGAAACTFQWLGMPHGWALAPCCGRGRPLSGGSAKMRPAFRLSNSPLARILRSRLDYGR